MPMQSSWLPKNKRKCAIRIKSKQKKKKKRKRKRKKERKRSKKTEKAPFKSFNIEPLFWMIYYRYYCIISFQKIFLFSKNPRIYLLWNRKVNWDARASYLKQVLQVHVSPNNRGAFKR